MFEIDVERQLGAVEIAVRLTSGPGLTALVGPSGVGKTTVLNMVAGLVRPDRGRIAVAGRTLFDAEVDLPPEARRAGYVFQDVRLFPHLRVRGNLRYGARLARRGSPSLGEDEIVSFLGIGALLDRWPSTLSGGEAQRIAIGRALLSAPQFLLMDEPLASLDRERREEVMQAIERIRDELALPILYVSHDEREVERLATHIHTM